MTTLEEVRIIQRVVRLMEHEARIRDRARRYELDPSPYAQAIARDLFTKASGYRKARAALMERCGIL